MDYIFSVYGKNSLIQFVFVTTNQLRRKEFFTMLQEYSNDYEMIKRKYVRVYGGIFGSSKLFVLSFGQNCTQKIFKKAHFRYYRMYCIRFGINLIFTTV